MSNPQPLDKANMKFVNLYFITREYGGPEEGGWYYDSRQIEMSLLCQTEEQAENIAKQLREQYKLSKISLSSVLSDGTYEVCISDEPGTDTPVPHYE